MRLIGCTVLLSVLLPAMSAPLEEWQRATSIYNFSATDIDGNVVSLEKYRAVYPIGCPKNNNDDIHNK
uniref:Uncharacterized protein n=1 Tax=Neolamprologus brichardi TaxID=32507 RepID=A0A3Q4I8P8_NEOBR